MAKNKQLIIQPKVGKNQFTKFVNHLEEEAVTMIYADPKSITNKKSKIQTVYTSPNAKYVILDKEKTSKVKGKKIGRKFKVLSNKDIDKIFESAKKGYVKELEKYSSLAIDTEGSGLQSPHRDKLSLVQVSTGNNDAYIIQPNRKS